MGPHLLDGQTTAAYHLHREISITPNVYVLKTVAPDATSVEWTTADLKNRPVGEYFIRDFVTATGDPGRSGQIPSGSVVIFSLWMAKTGNWGTIFPKAKLYLNSAAGTALCTQTATSALTTTVTKYVFSCSTPAAITLTNTDRFYLWIGVNVSNAVGNHSATARLDVEGIQDQQYDSQVNVPLPPPPPIITELGPPNVDAGTSVTISGSNFGAQQGTSTITFNGVAATPTLWQAYVIQAPVPATATSGPVVVTVAGLTSNSVWFTVTPRLTSVNPATGIVGTAVTISGTGFGSTQGSSTVTFNGVRATPSNWTNSSITTPVPTGATSGNVVVTVGNSAADGLSFTVGPEIVSLSPAAGPTGTAVNITGWNFGLTPTDITFNGVSASPTVWGPTRIVAAVPSGASTGPVVVTAGALSSNGVAFTIGTGGLTGTISRQTDGTPISGAIVEALQQNTLKGTKTSAADGTYLITGLSPGTYDLRVSGLGFGSRVLASNAVAPGSPTFLNVSLNAPGTLSGTVTKADGVMPLPNAGVTVMQGPTTVAVRTTSEGGTYTLDTLSAGTYLVKAAADGYQSQTKTNIGIVAGSTSTLNFQLAGQPRLTYTYDENGRLVGHVNSLGDVARYNYDAVGNITSIARSPANQTSIIEFTPNSGTVGTQVTIYGTAFSTTPSQNTVTFNGVPATVISSSTSQIVTTVPASATTGQITVSTPNGASTSTASFSVTP